MMAELESATAKPPGGWMRLGLGLAVGMIALYVAACLHYVLGPTLGGHGETSVVCTAWVFIHGRPLYPGPQAAERYAMVYGPMSAALPGALFWLLGPRLAVVKMAGGVMALAGLACCGKVYRRTAGDGGRMAALLGLGWLALVYLKFAIITYYVRPDAALQLCLALCLLAALAARGRWWWLLLGAAVGWGINLKITMPVYVFPLLALFWRRQGWRSLCLAGVLAAVLAALPFVVFPQVSAGAFLDALSMAVAEGTERSMIVPVGEYLVVLAGPALCAAALLALRRPAAFQALAPRRLWFGACAAVTTVAVLRITGKPGAGPAHLLPLFPILGLVLVKALAELGAGATTRPGGKKAVIVGGAGVVLLAILVGYALKATWVEVISPYPWGAGAALNAEVNQWAEQYPGQGMAMGVGATREQYFTNRCQPALVLRGNPYVLDVPAMMDMQKAGRTIPEATRAYMAAGTCPLWLIPRGEAPFALRNWYEPHGMIFDEAFQRVFREHYRIVGHSEHFDVWRYEGG